MPTKWMATRVSGITMIAWFGDFRVTVRITAMNTAVSTASTTNAWSSMSNGASAVGPGWFTVAATTDIEVITKVMSDAANAPISCATA